jgi:hypothetical protein
VPAAGASSKACGADEAPHSLRRALAAWHRAECGVAVAAFAAIALLLIVDLLGRELLGPALRAVGAGAGAGGIHGAPKIAVYALAVGTWAGLGIAAATGSHLVPRVAFGAVPAAWDPVVDRLADAVTALVLAAAAVFAAQLVHGTWQTGLLAPVLEWPVWPVQLVMPIGLLSAALRCACFACWPALRPPRPDAL